MHAAAGQQIPHPIGNHGEYTEYNKAPPSLAIVVTLVIIALSIFLVRVYTRTRLLQFFGIDDWLMSIAILCTIEIISAFVSVTKHSVEAFSWAIEVDGPHRLSYSLGTWIPVNIFSLGFTKLSIAFFLLQAVQRPVYRKSVAGLIVIFLVSTIVWIRTIVFQCMPLKAAWNRRIKPARCLSKNNYRILSLSNQNNTTDCVLACLSILVVFNPQVGLRKKASLLPVLGLGFVACAASVIKMTLLYNMWKQDGAFA
ncbi:hypothetical protein B0J11DRAFT_434125 [Dendryphion nanum]|uniref:Rhodopsin domain-containing protein n=1 Tax=Dendryphion nanum TaxID=256645 RepID=A0A9P9DW09_9PLEO|nr:hypothetical protein B0J11DRAFT_434125 [Dendryphion nanum]